MFKDNLIMLRNLHGYSQEQVAEIVNISRQAYAKWEKGETVPDIERCAKLAEVYGTTIDAMMSFNPEDQKMKVPPAPKGKFIWGTVVLNERGQIVIPKAARDKLQMKTGERLVVLGDENEGIALIKADLFEERIEAALKYANHDNEQS